MVTIEKKRTVLPEPQGT